MKYKYTGRVPAVVLVEDDFVTIQPGEIREFIAPPASTNFNAVVVEGKKKKKKVSTKQEKINATNADTSSLG